ncbi:hypothetical protein PV327_010777 [Microctonus hyperodae]|uniref:Uncharacterized protein n=1 Tax=Microctonus hyperodae TaxID=165561 RepID=A0AA39C852_MICHY|nr:hypothetical protein PV327_010777 [Microctonus hyperodae]
MASGNAEGSNNIPQWKRDLIQRRRQQQNKILIVNGVKIITENDYSVPLSTNDNQLSNKIQSDNNQYNETINTTTSRGKLLCDRGDSGNVVEPGIVGQGNTGGASVAGGTIASSTNRESLYSGSMSTVAATSAATITTTLANSVASNMRLEAEVFVSPTSEEPPKFVGKNNSNYLINNTEHSTITTKTTPAIHEQFVKDNSRNFNNTKKITLKNNNSDNKDTASILTMDNKNNDKYVFSEFRKRNFNKILSDANNKLLGNGKAIDDCESDSSEELQYGPGIVNKLKSKYLNLTLREMNKTRMSVQRFRRAASLEDLLDCNADENDYVNSVDGDGDEDNYYDDDGGGGDNGDEPEKIQRKFLKKTMIAGVAAKTERYRNATRGNDSIKRARSVETLMRYQAPIDDVKTFNFTTIMSKATPQVSFIKQQQSNDSNDDHIVLIDRSSVKIESRLGDCEQVNHQRPKLLNKPKRLKPLLAETERPPPDLVKTTMKIFEGSVKKLKPKGEVAIKVATFKTINDTFKAQTMKKCIPKPPIQPKPYVNGIPNKLTSPKKIVLKSVCKNVTGVIEKIDNIEDGSKKKNSGVITETIVQSVSSVVSKFQQIEKSQSPSPEPNLLHKHKYSPTPSPEPQPSSSSSVSSTLLINKQKTIVDTANTKSPPLTPRTLSPLVPSPKKDISRLNSSDINSIIKLNNENSTSENSEMGIEVTSNENCQNNCLEKNNVIASETSIESEFKKKSVSDIDDKNNDVLKIDIEMVDSPRTITKLALDNISKAGSSIKFNFDGESSVKKNYLPGLNTNGEHATNSSTDKKDDGLDNNTSNVENNSIIGKTPKEISNQINEKFIGEKELEKSLGNDKIEISSVESIKLSCVHDNEIKTQMSRTKNIKMENVTMPQKQIGIIRPLVTTKTQQISQQQNLSNRELEKNLINRVKSIEQPTKVVVSMKNSEEIQPVMNKNCGNIGGDGGSGGLWDTKPWNQQNNTMVFNFSNRKDVPDYIENDGLIIRRKREKTKASDGGIIVLDATLDASTTDDSDWEISGGPPSPCDVSFLNDNILINGRSNLSKSPRNHKNRIQFDDTATRTFEYPSEASMLEDEGTSVDGETSASGIEQQQHLSQLSIIGNKSNCTNTTNPILGGGGLSSYTPSKVDLVSEGFELGITRALTSTPTLTTTAEQSQQRVLQELVSNDETDENNSAKSSIKDAAWGAEAAADILY